MSRNRSYCFTINNYTDEDIADIKTLSEQSSYLIVGKEIGDNGTPHFQGFVYFKDAKTFTSVKKKLPRAHIEASKGSPLDNQRYCSKQEVYLEVGILPKQGERTDIEKTIAELQNGANMRGIVNTARNIQNVKMAEIWLKYNEEKRDWKPQVRWYHGSTGSGKTRQAREWLADDIYTCLDTIKWWEGYDKHENILIDDFRKDWCKFHQLLKLLDRYEYKVETKGGSRQLLAKKIAITAPYHPSVIYQTREDVQQLLRRIDEIILIGELVESDSDIPDRIN